MKPETILQSIKVGYELDNRVYNEIFDFKSKYNWITAIRYCISRRAAQTQGVEVEELPKKIKKYDSLFWRNLYRVYVNLNRLRELYF